MENNIIKSVAIFGSTSKLAQVFAEKAKLEKIDCLGFGRSKSRMEHDYIGDIFQAEDVQNVLNDADAILFLIAFSDAPFGLNLFSEVITVNVVSLIHLLVVIEKINLPKIPLLFFSSAHVYQLSNIKKNKYNEQDLCLSNSIQKWVEEISDFLFDKTEALYGIHRPIDSLMLAAVREYLQQNPFPMNELLIHDNYYYVYEISKIICENVLVRYSNSIIIRASYGYGYNDHDNMVASIVSKIFRNEEFTLRQGTYDFIFYDDLGDITLACLNRSHEFPKPFIINAVLGQSVLANEFIDILNEISRNFGYKMKYRLLYPKRNECTYSAELCQKILNCIQTRTLTSFEDGLKQIFFRLFINYTLHAKVLSEYIGGSTARIYLLEKSDGQKEIFKIALGEGAENGRTKLKNEIIQLKSTHKILLKNKKGNLVPTISEHYYSKKLAYFGYQYIQGKVLSDFIMDPGYREDGVLSDIEKIYSILLDTYRISSVKAPDTFFDYIYLGRISRRLDGLLKTLTNDGVMNFIQILASNEIIINGKRFINPIRLLQNKPIEEYYYICKPQRLSFCIHGDVIMDNIIKTNECFMFIDPRGDVFWKNGVPYFDPIYDIGKLVFYFYGWKLIRLEQFFLSTATNSDQWVEVNFKFVGNLTERFKSFNCKIIPLITKLNLQDPAFREDRYFLFKLHFAIAAHFLSDTLPRALGKGKHKYDQAIAEFFIGTIILNHLFGEASVDYSKVFEEIV